MDNYTYTVCSSNLHNIWNTYIPYVYMLSMYEV